MSVKEYFVYIMTNRTKPVGVLYIGVTNSISQRVWQHKNGIFPGFTAKYKLKKLIYYERFDDINVAIAREKQLKTWRREKKIWLIKNQNLNFEEIKVDIEASWR